jgi:hypothetical protein
MKPGEVVRIYRSGKFSGDEVLTGLVLNVLHVDESAKQERDDNKRWIYAILLIDGRPKAVDVYWDDEVVPLLDHVDSIAECRGQEFRT